MAFASWRGTVGLVNPTMRPSLEELFRIMPRGIGIIPLFNNIRAGTLQEFHDVIPGFEARVAELAEAGVDLVHPAGAPPFMVLGYENERKLVAEWERKYKLPIFTSGQNQIAAFRALKIQRFVGFSYIPGDVNQTFARYFQDAGFDVLAMKGMDVAFQDVHFLSNRAIYRFIHQTMIDEPSAEGIYLLGPAWRTLEIVELLEKDFGLPVVQHVAAQVWEIQKRLRVREPISGYGRLLAELP